MMYDRTSKKIIVKDCIRCPYGLKKSLREYYDIRDFKYYDPDMDKIHVSCNNEGSKGEYIGTVKDIIQKRTLIPLWCELMDDK